MPQRRPPPVPAGLQRGAHPSREQWSDSARFARDLLGRASGSNDLADLDVLDVGCGTKLAMALLEDSAPIGGYVGVDVSPEVIRWLRKNVSDERFEFHHLNAHNSLYNPDGRELASFDLLPVGPRCFDVICLFSVFTHLAPHDYVAMLRLLRRHAKPTTTLLFSLYVKEPGESSALARRIEELLASADREDAARLRAALIRAAAEPDASPNDRPSGRFTDEIPDNPLEIASYDRDYALELVDGTGWEVVSLNPPEDHIQHYMICTPA